MATVSDFLNLSIDTYLLRDLASMKPLKEEGGVKGGAVTYPMLMSTFAGIELLGAVLSKSKFNPRPGNTYFKAYWTDFLYAHSPDDAAKWETVFQLARHGIAHMFVLKGSGLMAVKALPQYHLKIVNTNDFCIDAVQLAADFETSYTSLVKPYLTTGSANVDPVEMQKRVKEIEDDYEQVAKDALGKILPATTSTPAPAYVMPPGASGSFGSHTTGLSSPAKGVTGPLGPPKSDTSSNP